MKKKRINCRAKGMRTEREAEQSLRNKGWDVFRPSGLGWSKFCKNKDLFGLFDIVAVKGYRKKWIQVKSAKPDKAVETALRAWSVEHANSLDTVELWVRLSRRKWLIRTYKSGEYSD